MDGYNTQCVELSNEEIEIIIQSLTSRQSEEKSLMRINVGNTSYDKHWEILKSVGRLREKFIYGL